VGEAPFLERDGGDIPHLLGERIPVGGDGG
jgi:hypothetical protein